MIQFYALLLLSAVVFQPLMLVCSFILRFLWHPPKQHPDFKVNPCPDKSLVEMKSERLHSFDRNKLDSYGDAAKLVGMCYWVLRTGQAWKRVTALFDLEQKTFLRRAHMPEGREKEVTFSGDMLSGMLAAITDRVLTTGLKDSEKETLCHIWANCSWSRWPMLIPHQTGKKSLSRGSIWRPWAVWSSASLLTLLVWLGLGWLITGERRYHVAYYLTAITHFPALCFAPGDGQAFVGKVYALSMHTTHSYALIAASACRLGIPFGIAHLPWLAKRYGDINADIAVLGHLFGGVRRTQEELTTAVAHCYAKAYDADRKVVVEDTKYLDLIWPPKWVTKGAMLYPPSYTHHDYCSERSPVARGGCYGTYGEAWGLDTIFPAILLLRGEGLE